MKTHPQTRVWVSDRSYLVWSLHLVLVKGGSMYNMESVLPDIEAATVAFQETVTDPKAAVIMTYNYVPSAQQVTSTFHISGAVKLTPVYLRR